MYYVKCRLPPNTSLYVIEKKFTKITFLYDCTKMNCSEFSSWLRQIHKQLGA